jgi:hypothetical protein
MNRIDIKKFVDFGYLDIRPSVLERFETELFIHGGLHYESLCSMSEKSLLSIEGFTRENIDCIKNELARYGLSLNMSKQDIVDYKDAEYIKAHQLKEPQTVIKEKSDELPIAAIAEEKIKEALLEEPKVHITEDVMTQSDYEKKVNISPFEKGFLNDQEWMLHQIRMRLLIYQPWYIKTFCPFSWRLQIAMGQAEEMFKAYKEDFVERAIKYAPKSIESNIK